MTPKSSISTINYYFWFSCRFSGSLGLFYFHEIVIFVKLRWGKIFKSKCMIINLQIRCHFIFLTLYFVRIFSRTQKIIKVRICWTGDRYYSRYVPYKFHLRNNPIRTKNDLQAELSNFIESNNFQKIDLNEALLPFVPFKGQIVSFCSLPQRSSQYASPEAFDVLFWVFKNF